jgi:LacI family transcriptional regulator
MNEAIERAEPVHPNRSTPKLSDVARMAGVSPATASRALSSPKQVRPETRARVEHAARMLGYVPHGAARALASRRSRTLGAVIPTLDNAIFANSVNALQRSLAESRYTLLLASHDYDPAVELEVTSALIERGVDGIVFVGTDHDPELYRLLAAFRIPYVLTWSLDPSRRHPCVGFNNREAAIRVTRYLLDLGHREFAVISGLTAHNDRARDRVAGVRDALRARGLDLAPQAVIEKPYAFSSGQEAMEALMARSPRPSAVVCINDVLAVGAIIACQVRGIGVPREVSITGFDDMPIAAQLPPGLTTMRMPTIELGRSAAAYLLDRLAGRSVAPSTELPVELVVRGSTAPPARQASRKA